MKGLIKGCFITALVCIVAGIIVLTASISAVGWHEAGRMMRQGMFSLVWSYDRGDFDWTYVNPRLKLAEARESLREERQNLRDAKQEILDVKQEILDVKQEMTDAGLELREGILEAGREINEEIRGELEDAMSEIGDSLQESFADGADNMEEGLTYYQRAGGDSIGSVIASGYEIRHLDIDFGAGGLYLVPSTDDQIRMASMGGTARFNCYRDGDTLVFQDESDNRTSDYRNRRIYLSVPADLVLESADINIGAGIFTAEALWTDQLQLYVGAGQAVLGEVYAGWADVQTGAGEILISEGSIKDMDLSIGAGHVAYIGAITGNIQLQTGVGSAELVLAGSSTEHNYVMDAAVGNVMIDGRNHGGFGVSEDIDNGADSTFELSSAMGIIRIEFTD